MDELITRAVTGEASDLELRKLARWREVSDANDLSYLRSTAAWLAAAPRDEAPVGPAPDAAALIARADARRKKDAGRNARRAFAHSPRTGYSLAVVALGALLVVGVRAARDTGLHTSLFAVQSSMGRGQVVTMSLSDGSLVRAAPSTQLRFRSSRGRREVVLDGRAFFAVARGMTPFVVHTTGGDVTVTGTRFELLTEPGMTRVVVVEGTVNVGGVHGTADVRPGQVAFLAPDSGPRVVDRQDPWDLLQWEGGLLLFQGTPLKEVASEIGRQFGRDVRVVRDLSDKRVTAWFDDESLDEVVSAVCLLVAAPCRITDEAVIIGSQAPGGDR